MKFIAILLSYVRGLLRQMPNILFANGKYLLKKLTFGGFIQMSIKLMKKMFASLCCALGFSLFALNPSQAADAFSNIAVEVLGGANLSMNSASTSIAGATLTVASSRQFTFGLGVGMDVGDSIGIEMNALYYPRKLSSTIQILGISSTIETNLTTLLVPVYFRYTILPEYLSVGIGPYADFVMGNTTSQDGNTIASSGAYASTDFGGSLLVKGAYPVAPAIQLTGNVIYNYGLSNLVTNTDYTWNARELVLLLGARVSL